MNNSKLVTSSILTHCLFQKLKWLPLKDGVATRDYLLKENGIFGQPSVKNTDISSENVIFLTRCPKQSCFSYGLSMCLGYISSTASHIQQCACFMEKNDTAFTKDKTFISFSVIWRENLDRSAEILSASRIPLWWCQCIFMSLKVLHVKSMAFIKRELKLIDYSSGVLAQKCISACHWQPQNNPQ